MKNGIKILGFILTIVGVVLKVLLTGMKTNVVIYQGIATFRSYNMLANGIIILGIIILAVGLFLWMKAHVVMAKTETNKKKTLKMMNEKKKSYSPEAVRQSIELMQKDYPNYSFDKCIAQLDKMDDYQLRLHNLLESNDLEAFAYTEEILDDVEMALCKGMKSFLNYLIVTDDSEKINEKFKAMLNTNQDRFMHVQKLLLTLADFVDENINSRDATEKIQFCNEAIRQTMREESE